MRCSFRSAALLLACAAIPASAPAAVVNFQGQVINLCVLTLTTPGALGISSSGLSLSSQEVGGLPATLTVVATGANPTLAFGAPALTGPSASISGASQEIAYSSPGGASQNYTSGASTYVMSRLLDTLTVTARASNASGFVSGSYAIASTVTCQQ